MKYSFCKLALCVFMLVVSNNSAAYSECERSVKRVWNNLVTESVYVCFDTGSCIFKTGGQLTSGQMARFFSMALTAQTTGLRLKVRYPEDDLVCPPTEASRSDSLGMWLVD